MAMAVDSRQQLGGLPYEQMRYTAAPQFTNPWVSAPGAASGHMYASAMPQGAVNDTQARHHQAMTSTPATTAGMTYASSTLPSLSIPSGYAPRPYGADYPSASTASTGGYSTATSAAPHYAPSDYATSAAHHQQQKLSPYGSFQDRRSSHPLHSEAERNSFSDALDASRGMVGMSQDITPRNIYGTQSSRSSTDSYGFPSTHSSNSSISSASTYGTYYGSSVSEASYGDYSSASESVDVPNRTLPRPNGLVGASLPPAPQSMMGQFSSKVSSSSQKKHKCKICDKRFTRPSSLQTHMYSHTGEKPFSCDVEGCGRHFSVVSNLRRHKKVHKGGSDHPSPDDD